MAPSPTRPPTAMMMSLSDSLRLAGAALPPSPSGPSASDCVSFVFAIAPAPLCMRCAPGRQDGTQDNAAGASLGTGTWHRHRDPRLPMVNGYLPSSIRTEILPSDVGATAFSACL